MDASSTAELQKPFGNYSAPQPLSFTTPETTPDTPNTDLFRSHNLDVERLILSQYGVILFSQHFFFTLSKIQLSNVSGW